MTLRPNDETSVDHPGASEVERHVADHRPAPHAGRRGDRANPVTLTATVTAFTGLGQVLTAGFVLVLLTWWVDALAKPPSRRASTEVRERHPSGAQ